MRPRPVLYAVLVAGAAYAGITETTGPDDAAAPLKGRMDGQRKVRGETSK